VTDGPTGVAPRRGDRHRLWWLTGPLVVIAAAAIAGNAFAPALLDRAPLLLLALNATTRHLVLTATSVDVVPYLLVGLGRRVLEDPFLFLLGRWYGDDAVAWIDAKVGGGRYLRWVQRHFTKVGYVLVALFPGGVVIVLAGASGMNIVVFFALNIAGTIATILALRWAGDSVSGPVDAIVAFTGDHVVVLTVASVALTAGWLLWQRRDRGHG
jgi:membrane protein DedA with SNARE-associated domain